MKRALSVDDLLKTKFKMMQFDNIWKDSFGTPEISGVWLVWGQSGNGKTRFSLQLAKYLCSFGRVAYNTMEEGARRSFQKAVEETNMREVSGKFIILNRESMADLKARLSKRRSPDIVIIDSIQYTGITKEEYKQLKQEFSNKLFIFLSHAIGKQPKGSVAEFVRYDADIKIFVEGYMAFPVSRFGGGSDFIIWQHGADLYHGLNINHHEKPSDKTN